MASGDAVEMQRLWYGEPLGDLFGRLISELGLNQARLAGLLGLSAPMLSQLMNGRRAKIGNPIVVQRLQALQDLAAQLAAGRLGPEEATARMEEIRGTGPSGTGSLGGLGSNPSMSVAGGVVPAMHVTPSTGSAGAGTAANRPAPAAVVQDIQSLLRTLASAAELIDVATSLAPTHPELAEFLRVYGAGRTDEAIAHYEAHQLS
jgi:hypothetical protein